MNISPYIDVQDCILIARLKGIPDCVIMSILSTFSTNDYTIRHSLQTCGENLKIMNGKPDFLLVEPLIIETAIYFCV